MDKKIKSTSEISLEDLLKYQKSNKYSRIVVVTDNKTIDSAMSYSIEDMIQIKEKIIEIVDDVKSKYSGPDKDKKIFTYIYTKLAHLIDYDDFAASTVGLTGYDRDRTEQYRNLASNLFGGLINGKSMCGGYSEILRNVLSEVGIKSLYISGIAKDGTDKHAWNQVCLDNEWYNVDLTNDRDNIVENIKCEHFLKSDIDFSRYQTFDVVSPNLEKCPFSIENYSKLFEECAYIPVTLKDIAYGTKSSRITTSETSTIKSFFSRFLNRNDNQR